MHKFTESLVLYAIIGASTNSFSNENKQLESNANAFDDAIAQHAAAYLENCAVCHGERLEGAAQGPALIGDLKHGSSHSDIERSIANGFTQQGMPAWSNTLSSEEIKKLALYIGETRKGLSYTSFHYEAKLELPTEVINSKHHPFRLETIISDLDPQPYSIALLPDGRLLLTEKKHGLRIISMDGTKTDYISGTPKAYADTFVATSQKQELGYGWILDVALHPDYDKNQWIYLHFTDRCEDCNAFSKTHGRPVSMNKIIRGRIRNGTWEDEETIWKADKKHYGSIPDLAAGGRLAFDGNGHLFFSVGAKGHDMFTGIQDLSSPWGKIHRIVDNGDIPKDNPYVATEDAFKSIWTYGHRSPQGLEFRTQTSQLWGSEMGPRGGDELNLLLRGKNYGWPLHSNGLNYDGTTVDYGSQLGIAFELKDIQQPVIDFTPAPAISSFVFYTGKAFKSWQEDILIGSLKGRSLKRITLNGDKPSEPETLFSGIARVRDIEIGKKGEVFLLLENNAGSLIARMVPVTNTCNTKAIEPKIIKQKKSVTTSQPSTVEKYQL